MAAIAPATVPPAGLAVHPLHHLLRQVCPSADCTWSSASASAYLDSCRRLGHLRVVCIISPHVAWLGRALFRAVKSMGVDRHDGIGSGGRRVGGTASAPCGSGGDTRTTNAAPRTAVEWLPETFCRRCGVCRPSNSRRCHIAGEANYPRGHVREIQFDLKVIIVKVQSHFSLEMSAGSNAAPAHHGADVQSESALDRWLSSAANSDFPKSIV